MKKRVFGILLSLALVLTMMPVMSTPVYAESDFSDLVVNSGDTEKTLPGKEVKFNGEYWYIIKDNSAHQSNPTVTLFATSGIANYQFDDNSNDYNSSIVKSYLDGLTGTDGNFAGVADAIAATDLTDVGVTGAKLYLLSKSEAEGLPVAARKNVSKWWLRTKENSTANKAYKVVENGDTIDTYDVDYALGVRPALQLDLNKVTFDSEKKTFAVAYPLWVGGTQVTSTDFYGDGWVYVAGTNTLRLTDAEIYGSKDFGGHGTANIYYSENKNLKIVLVGENKVGDKNNLASSAISAGATQGSVTIEGDGSLTAYSFGDTIYGYNGVTINGGQITATASAHNAISTINSNVSINGGTIIACGPNRGIRSTTVSIGNDMSVMAGDDESSAILVKDTSTWEHNEKWVQVAEAYPLWIKGTHVTSANMKDVLGDGKVSYDPDANILKLKGANITADSEKQYSGAAIYYEDKENDLTVDSTAASTVKAAGGDDSHGIYSMYRSLAFNGTLNVTGGVNGIVCNGNNLTVNGKLTATGKEVGIYLDKGDVTVNSGADLSAAGDVITGIAVNDNSGTVTIKEGAKVSSVGGKAGAIDGLVKNAITGTGWTNAAGTEGEAKIPVNTAGQTLTYKKVQFPGKTDPAPAPATAPASDPTAVGTVHAAGGSLYIVTSEGTVSLVKAPSKKTYTLPAMVQLYGKPFIVTGIAAKAFKGTKVRTLTVKTMGLTKATVKGSLKGSKIKTVKVKVGKKKVNKKYVKKYKKIFTKKNAGKKVRVW